MQQAWPFVRGTMWYLETFTKPELNTPRRSLYALFSAAITNYHTFGVENTPIHPHTALGVGHAKAASSARVKVVARLLSLEALGQNLFPCLLQLPEQHFLKSLPHVAPSSVLKASPGSASVVTLRSSMSNLPLSPSYRDTYGCI